MVFCCEFPFSLFHSVVFLTLALFPLFWSAMPQALNSSSRFIFFFKLQGPGEMGWDGSPLFKLRLSKCFMHYNEKGHLYSHRALSVSPYICPSSETEYFRLLSLTTETRALFPTHHLFFKPRFYPKQLHNTPIFFPLTSSLSTLEYPVFHLAAQWAVWMCLFSYVTSFLELLPLVQCHCITYQLLCATQWESLFSAFLRHKYDPLMEMALSWVLTIELPTTPPPHTGQAFQQCDLLHNGTEETKVDVCISPK